MDRCKEALGKYQECLKIFKEILGEKHRLYAETLNNMGLVYDKLGVYEEALKRF